MNKSTAAIIIFFIVLNLGTVTVLYHFRRRDYRPTDPATPAVVFGQGTDPDVVYIVGKLNYTVYEGDCYRSEFDEFFYANSYASWIGDDAIAVVLKTCASIDAGSVMLSTLMFRGHDYTQDATILYGEYEVVVTFLVV